METTILAWIFHMKGLGGQCWIGHRLISYLGCRPHRWCSSFRILTAHVTDSFCLTALPTQHIIINNIQPELPRYVQYKVYNLHPFALTAPINSVVNCKEQGSLLYRLCSNIDLWSHVSLSSWHHAQARNSGSKWGKIQINRCHCFLW